MQRPPVEVAAAAAATAATAATTAATTVVEIQVLQRPSVEFSVKSLLLHLHTSNSI